MLRLSLLLPFLLLASCRHETTSSPLTITDLRPERIQTHFRDIQFAPGSDHAWAVGFEGTILHSTNAGQDFESQSSGTHNRLYDIHAVSEMLAFTCGANGTILVTENGGTQWKMIPPPTLLRLVGICFLNRMSGWVCGDNGLILRTTNGGTSWTKLSVGTTSGLRTIHFHDPFTGFVVGYSGAMYRTSDGGDSWIQLSLPAGANIYGSAFNSDARFIIVCGSFGLVFTSSDNGDTWQRCPMVTTNFLRAVAASDPDTYFLAGYGVILRYNRQNGLLEKILHAPGMALHAIAFGANNSALSAGQLGSLYLSTDSGISWTLRPEFLSPDLFDLATDGNGSIVAVGAEGHVFRMTSPLATPEHLWLGTNSTQKAITWICESRFVSAGSDGSVALTSDSGATWHLSRITDRNLNDIAFPTIESGFIVGDCGYIAQSTDQGITWTETRSGSLDSLHGIAFANTMDGILVGSNGCIRGSENGGTTWYGMYTGVSSDFTLCTFTSNHHSFAAGNRGIILESFSGGSNSSWNRIPCPSEITAISDDGQLTFHADLSIRKQSSGERIGTTNDCVTKAIRVDAGTYLCCGHFGYLARIRFPI